MSEVTVNAAEDSRRTEHSKSLRIDNIRSRDHTRGKKRTHDGVVGAVADDRAAGGGAADGVAGAVEALDKLPGARRLRCTLSTTVTAAWESSGSKQTVHRTRAVSVSTQAWGRTEAAGAARVAAGHADAPAVRSSAAAAGEVVADGLTIHDARQLPRSGARCTQLLKPLET